MPKRNSRRRRRRRGGTGPLLRLLSVLLMAVAIVAALTLFFKVQEIEVTGNSRYTREEILAAAGVETGDNLILLDKYGISQRIYNGLPYVTDVRPMRRLPGKLVIEVTETYPAAAVRGDGAWWLVSSSGKILEAASEQKVKDFLPVHNVTAQAPEPAGRLALGEEDNITVGRLLELLQAMEERNILARVDSIDAGDEAKLVVEYDGRFRVEMYYDADFRFKLNCLESAVAQLEPNETGVLRMTMDDDDQVRFIPFG